MRVAILQFWGSNCDWDAEHAIGEILDSRTEFGTKTGYLLKLKRLSYREVFHLETI